nr:UDP-glycosyltranserase [Gynostemma pentaphyllum]
MESKNRASILLFPWLAHGHISPFFELAKSLSKRNFLIYFCSTSVNLETIKQKLQSSSFPNIHLVELHLPSSTDLPPHLHTANALPSHLIPSLIEAFSMSSQNFQTILQSLKPNLLIYDSLQPWAPLIASKLNIPAVNYINTGSLSITIVLHYLHNPDSKFPFLEILKDETIQKTASEGDKKKAREAGEGFLNCFLGSRDLVLINTFREIEGEYLDYITLLSKKKVLPIGPLIHEPNDDSHIITEWLDKKEPSSTVFVSFGTECFPPKEEMEEIANGLEMSEANFIWVIRFPHGDDRTIEEGLPEGFLERVERSERGMVIKDWAPQIKILKHENIGCFVSHCGWNSVMESLISGVPIIALPKHLDQPLNARLVETIGVGVEAKRNGNGKIQRDVIAKLIKQVMVEKSGENIRKKAKEMSEFFSRTSFEERMDHLVAEISTLMNSNVIIV